MKFNNYLLNPWCRVLLEKLTGLQLVKKFPEFHGTRRFITALTSVRHLSLSWASPVQAIYPHTTSWRSVLILSTHLRLGLPSGLLPSGFSSKTLYTHLYVSQTVSQLLLMHVCLTSFPRHKNKWEYSLECVTRLVFRLLRVTSNDSNAPVRARDFSVLRNVQTGFGAHPASCAVRTRSYLLGVKGSRACC